MFKGFWLPTFAFIAFWVILIFTADNSDNPLAKLIMLLLELIQTTFSLFGIILLVLLVLSFIIFLLSGFLIARGKKFAMSESILYGFFWLLAWIHIILTFLSVSAGSSLIFYRVLGIDMSMDHEGSPNSIIGGFLIIPVLLLSAIPASGVYSFWFKSKKSPLTKFMKNLE